MADQPKRKKKDHAIVGSGTDPVMWDAIKNLRDAEKALRAAFPGKEGRDNLIAYGLCKECYTAPVEPPKDGKQRVCCRRCLDAGGLRDHRSHMNEQERAEQDDRVEAEAERQRELFDFEEIAQSWGRSPA